MFIYSMRASNVKFFSLLTAFVAIVVALVAFIPAITPVSGQESSLNVTYQNVDSNEERIAFLSSFGWEVNPQCEEEVSVTIPSEFDKVFANYNQIQKEQGLDLSNLRRKEVTRYTYEVKNYPDYDGKVLANLLVYHGDIVGGDICSEDSSGFIHGFSKE